MRISPSLIILALWLLRLIPLVVIAVIAVLVIRALRAYVKSHSRPPEDRPEAAAAPSKTLAQALKDHRTRCKLTQEYVAEAVGVSRQAVSKWETGESEPTMSNLTLLAKVYGVSLAQLLEDVT